MDVCWCLWDDFDAVCSVIKDGVHGVGGGESCPAEVSSFKGDFDCAIVNGDLVFFDVVVGAGDVGW